MTNLFELDPSVTYLNCASMSPLLKSARQAGMDSLQARATPWNMTSKEWFDDSEVLRELVARVFQTSSQNIAFSPAASYGMATVCKNVKPKKGQSVIILDKQFPSNVYAWEHLSQKHELNLIRVKKEKERTLTESVVDAIQPNTALVAIPNCHWMDGTYVDLEKVSVKVKSVGALLALDLSQSLGALPINIDKVDPDFAVAAGYKWMLGPYGLGYMYIAPRWQQRWEPLENTWLVRHNSEDFSKLTDYTPQFKSGAKKFDFGEYLMLSLRAMSIAGVKQILDWGVDQVQNYAKGLTDIIKEYNESKGIPVQDSVGHIVAIPFGNRDPQKIKEALAKKNISVSYRDAFMRISPHLYNTREDVELLLSTIDSSR
jgi:selenocysteine lyase/cysteine desulfurase